MTARIAWTLVAALLIAIAAPRPAAASECTDDGAGGLARIMTAGSGQDAYRLDGEVPAGRYAVTVEGVATRSAATLTAGRVTIRLEQSGTGLVSTTMLDLRESVRQIELTGAGDAGGACLRLRPAETAGHSAGTTAADTQVELTRPACPLVASSEGVLVDFPSDWRLRANNPKATSRGPLDVAIPAGTYAVTLAAWDDHSTKDQVQEHEAYYVALTLADGSTVVTPPTADLPDDQDLLIQTVTDALVASIEATALTVHHILESAESAHSIEPICAAFEPVTAAPDEQPATPAGEQPAEEDAAAPTGVPATGPADEPVDPLVPAAAPVAPAIEPVAPAALAPTAVPAGVAVADSPVQVAGVVLTADGGTVAAVPAVALGVPQTLAKVPAVAADMHELPATGLSWAWLGWFGVALLGTGVTAVRVTRRVVV